MCVRFSSLFSLLVPSSCRVIYFFLLMMCLVGLVISLGLVCLRFRMGPGASVVGARGEEDT